jgi:hypothetical protein
MGASCIGRPTSWSARRRISNAPPISRHRSMIRRSSSMLALSMASANWDNSRFMASEGD